MPDFPPDTEDVVAVVSRQAGDDVRSFELQGEAPEGVDLPDFAEIIHENDLVAAMKELGYRLTMVGGGAGTGELRRFYFRRR
jgi:hypothetical protein